MLAADATHRMKSKPEYRHIFSSPSMFYRALHTISSQKYRMPVRRYIFDLFNIDLDADVVKQLSDCAIALRVPLTAPEAAGPSPAQEKPRETVVPTFQPRPARPVVSESDDEESDDEEEVTAKKPRAPVMSLRPKSRVIGFN